MKRRAPLAHFWNRLFGQRGERLAEEYLRGKGMRIITRGYEGPNGEIDLIARDGDVLVFIEVKTRRGGNPVEAVDEEKQRRITLTALHFLKRHRLLEKVSWRYDIVAIVWPDEDGEPNVQHFSNAFESVGRWQMFR